MVYGISVCDLGKQWMQCFICCRGLFWWVCVAFECLISGLVVLVAIGLLFSALGLTMVVFGCFLFSVDLPWAYMFLPRFLVGFARGSSIVGWVFASGCQLVLVVLSCLLILGLVVKMLYYSLLKQVV